MCRWMLYYGDPIMPSMLLFQTEHGLILQSESASTFTPQLERNTLRNHPINVHGSGLGYYPLRDQDCSARVMYRFHDGLTLGERPAVYTGALAPSHDRNLRRIAESVETPLFFAHIRAAGPFSPVSEFNSHPFRAGKYLFMHNGCVARFKRIRRELLRSLSQDSYERIQGRTDSEVCFAIFIDQVRGSGAGA